MTLMPMIFVTEMNRSFEFYTALGEFNVLEQSDAWAEVGVGAGAIDRASRRRPVAEGDGAARAQPQHRRTFGKGRSALEGARYHRGSGHQ